MMTLCWFPPDSVVIGSRATNDDVEPVDVGRRRGASARSQQAEAAVRLSVGSAKFSRIDIQLKGSPGSARAGRRRCRVRGVRPGSGDDVAAGRDG